MAEMWKPYDKSTYESWIDAIENEVSDELSDWEIGFVENIKLNLGFNNELSRAQSEKLESIYAKYTK